MKRNWSPAFTTHLHSVRSHLYRCWLCGLQRGFSLRFRSDVNVVKSPRTHFVRIEDLNPSGLAGFPYRRRSCSLALLWPKCDSQAAGANATMTQCGDPGIGSGALLAITMSFLSNFSLTPDFRRLRARWRMQSPTTSWLDLHRLIERHCCMLHSNNTRNLDQKIDNGGTRARCWNRPSRLE